MPSALNCLDWQYTIIVLGKSADSFMKTVDRLHEPGIPASFSLTGFMKPVDQHHDAGWPASWWQMFRQKSNSAIFFDFLLIDMDKLVELQKIYNNVENEDMLSFL